MRKERKLSQQIEENEGVLAVTAEQSNEQKEGAEDNPKAYEEDEDDDDSLWLVILSDIKMFIKMLIICGICVIIGYNMRPSDTDTYNQGYTDAIKDIVYLEGNDLTEESMSLLHVTAIAFYNDGVIDGTRINSLITEISMDENIPKEITNYYIDIYNKLWDNGAIYIDEVHNLINELKEVLNGESL